MSREQVQACDRKIFLLRAFVFVNILKFTFVLFLFFLECSENILISIFHFVNSFKNFLNSFLVFHESTVCAWIIGINRLSQNVYFGFIKK